MNTEQTIKLYEIIKEFCALTSDDILLDAYCGVGTIGMYVGRDARKIIGIESVSEAINNAKISTPRYTNPTLHTMSFLIDILFS